MSKITFIKINYHDYYVASCTFASFQASISDELKQLFEDRIKTLNNMAQAQLKLKAYEPALNSVDSVLKCQPKNVKALFRKGKVS